jgi:ABC-type transport system involved in multi-copper enzyme maturation permease subunit
MPPSTEVDNACNERSQLIAKKILGILAVILVCIVALTAPVGAAASGFVVTDPGTLVTLGIALVSIGLGTRKLLRSQKRKR